MLLMFLNKENQFPLSNCPSVQMLVWISLSVLSVGIINRNLKQHSVTLCRNVQLKGQSRLIANQMTPS